MSRRIISVDRMEYWLVALLLFFSGNPISSMVADKFALLLASALIIMIFYKSLKPDFYQRFFIISSALLILFFFQLMVLYSVSWLANFRYIVTILFGGLVFYLLGERFSYKLFIVIFYLSAISLVCYVVINLLGIHKFGIPLKMERFVKESYIIYTYAGLHATQNSGMFWEPGAFAGVLVFSIALNMKDFLYLWKHHRTKIFIIIIALLTTQSTTGYVAFFITIVYYFLFFMKNIYLKAAIIPASIILGLIVFKNADFLEAKIQDQTEKTRGLAKDEFSNTRFGSFVFDMHYIKKHPMVGNGFGQTTRYADHPYLIGEKLGNGNGFSNYMATLGIPFMIGYLLITFFAVSTFDKRLGLLMCVIILLTLFGEQWLNYPLYTGIIFINSNRNFP